MTRLRMVAWVVLAESLARIIGGTVLLYLLGAPRWALAAFLLLMVRIRLFYPRESKLSRAVPASGRKARQ